MTNIVVKVPDSHLLCVRTYVQFYISEQHCHFNVYTGCHCADTCECCEETGKDFL